MVTGAVDALARAAMLTPLDRLELALRQAGLRVDVEVFRRDCMYWLAGAPLLLGLAGTVTGNATCVALFFVLGIFVGLRRGRERLARGRRRRNEKLRNDLPTVAGALAVKIDNNRSLFVALSDLVERGDGPVLEDLARALHLAAAGYGEGAAFGLVAQESAEPAAARFYRLLAVATSGGLELSKALLDQANDLRRQRREEVERTAGRRQMALVMPSMVFMAPVLFAFMLAPLPRLLFAR
jgi:tight adherence protein C